MTEKSWARQHWKLILNVATLAALVLLIWLIRDQIVDTFHNLAHATASASLSPPPFVRSGHRLAAKPSNPINMSQILLIEPDLILAETYRQALLAAGHRVVCCASAQAGILSADQHCPDVIILELQLIEHSGIEFLYELRSYQDWQTVPVIIHSQVPPAEFNNHRRLLKDQLQVDTYLYKPQTSLSDLTSVVNNQLVVA